MWYVKSSPCFWLVIVVAVVQNIYTSKCYYGSWPQGCIIVARELFFLFWQLTWPITIFDSLIWPWQPKQQYNQPRNIIGMAKDVSNHNRHADIGALKALHYTVPAKFIFNCIRWSPFAQTFNLLLGYTAILPQNSDVINLFRPPIILARKPPLANLIYFLMSEISVTYFTSHSWRLLSPTNCV